MSLEMTANHQDLDLVQSSLEGNEASARELCERLSPFLTSLLISRGASPSAAEELLEALWTDCLTGNGDRPPLFHRYAGTSPLRAWLAAILFNRWISQRRHDAVQARARNLIGQERTECARELLPGEHLDKEMILILGQAVRSAMADCDAEEIVLLQLVHLHGVSQRALAQIAGCHESQLSRRLKATEKKIAEATLAAAHAHDPLLDLRWDDFLQLCENAAAWEGLR